MDVKEQTWQARTVSLRNKHNLHLRPVQRIVETASRFQAEVRVRKDDLDCSAKSLPEMIELAAYMVNRARADDYEFSFHARGVDAAEALEALAQLIEQRFGLEVA